MNYSVDSFSSLVSSSDDHVSVVTKPCAQIELISNDPAQVVSDLIAEERGFQARLWSSRMAMVCETAKFMKSLNVIDLGFGDHPYQWEVYLAIDAADRVRGLSNIELDQFDADGMIFYFQSPSYVPFTAAQMKFDFNIAWYASDKRLLKTQKVEAGHNQPLCCPLPFAYVLESQHPIPLMDLEFHA